MIKIVKGPNIAGILVGFFLVYLFFIGLYKMLAFVFTILVLPALVAVVYFRWKDWKKKKI